MGAARGERNTPSPRAYHSAWPQREDGLLLLPWRTEPQAASTISTSHISSMHWTSPRCDQRGAAADALLAHLRRYRPAASTASGWSSSVASTATDANVATPFCCGR